MISVIVPALNEARALPATLARLAPDAVAHEVFVVDGGSTDATRDALAVHPGARWLTAPPGRASQMNAGAAVAGGDWLLFLHADTLLPPGGLAMIASLPPAVEWGGFRHRFAGRDPRLRAVSALNNLRCRLTRVFYGDQAMFVRREVFVAAGGFPPVARLEDVMLSERLRARSRPAMLPAAAITDGRKFLQMGVAVSLWRVARILAAHRRGRPLPATEFFSNVR